MAVLVAFEVEVYQRAGIPVRFVGHPLVDEVGARTSPEAFRQEFEIPAEHRLVGLLPGSRAGEIRRIAPVLAQTAAHLARQSPNVSFVVPVADTVERPQLAKIFARYRVDASFIEGRTYDAVAACDAVATSSGTATLEIALLGTPMAIVYRVGANTERSDAVGEAIHGRLRNRRREVRPEPGVDYLLQDGANVRFVIHDEDFCHAQAPSATPVNDGSGEDRCHGRTHLSP